MIAEDCQSLDICLEVDADSRRASFHVKVQPEALSEDDVFHQISTGKGYMHTHLDNFGRPVLVVKVAKHFAGTASSHQPVSCLADDNRCHPQILQDR